MPAPLISALINRLLASEVATTASQSLKRGGSLLKNVVSREAERSDSAVERPSFASRAKRFVHENVVDLGERYHNQQRDYSAQRDARPQQQSPIVVKMPSSAGMMPRAPQGKRGGLGGVLKQAIGGQGSGASGGGGSGGGIAGAGIAADGALAAANPIGATIALTTAFVGLVTIGKKLGDTQLESQRGLARFNGTIAMAYAQLNRGDLLRQRASAVRTSGSTEALAGAINEMRNAVQPLADIGTNILNSIAVPFVRLVANIATGLSFLEKIYDWLPGLKPQPKKINGTWLDGINALAGEYRKKHTPKPRNPGKGAT